MKDETKPKRTYRPRKKKDRNLIGLILAGQQQLDAMKAKAIPNLLRERDVINSILRQLGHVDDPSAANTIIDVDAVVADTGSGEQRVPIAARRLTPALLSEKLALEKKMSGQAPTRRPRNSGKSPGAQTYGPNILCKACGQTGHDRRSHIHDAKKAAAKKEGKK